MYAVVLSYELRPPLRMVEEAHRFVLHRLAHALQPTASGEVQREGISDLAWRHRKFSGNSLRCKRTHLLYHGTLLYDFPLELIGACLRSPPRQPDYRAGRSHGDFLTNLPSAPEVLQQCLRSAWEANEALDDWPRDTMDRLTRERYTRHDWNHRR
jgi:lipoate-protein ligase A